MDFHPKFCVYYQPKHTYINYTLPLVNSLRSLVVKALHRHGNGVGSIPAGRAIVDGELFSTVPGLNFYMCMISTRIKILLPLRNLDSATQMQK